jgi:hypothetical protein
LEGGCADRADTPFRVCFWFSEHTQHALRPTVVAKPKTVLKDRKKQSKGRESKVWADKAAVLLHGLERPDFSQAERLDLVRVRRTPPPQKTKRERGGKKRLQHGTRVNHVCLPRAAPVSATCQPACPNTTNANVRIDAGTRPHRIPGASMPLIRRSLCLCTAQKQRDTHAHSTSRE